MRPQCALGKGAVSLIRQQWELPDASLPGVGGDCGTPLALYFNQPWGFPGSPLVRTPRVHCEGHRFDSWLGS